MLLSSSFLQAQTKTDSITLVPQTQINAAQRLLSGNYASAVTVGAYAEMLYNQPEGDNGELDVQRMVLLFGYRFNDKTQFVTDVTTGLTNHIALGVVLKGDYQFRSNALEGGDIKDRLNFGIGVWF